MSLDPCLRNELRFYDSPAKRTLAFALRRARQESNRARLYGCRVDDFSAGSVHGQILAAQFDMGADPVMTQAVRNESEFLMQRYGGAR